MKQAGYPKRSYGRSLDRSRSSQTKQSNDPLPYEGKMKGSPQQNVEKYLTLARDATSSGDPVSAENYYQFADHYYRMVVASRPPRPTYTPRRATQSTAAPHVDNAQAKPAPVAAPVENCLE